jgi:chromosome segregation ATPase
VLPGGLTESAQLIVLERTNSHLRHSLHAVEQERQANLVERNAAVAERDAIRAEIEGVRASLAEMTAERDGLVAAGTDVLDEGVERIDRFLEAARERVSALVDRLLDENERLGRRLAAAERVAAAQAEIAESLLDRVEGDVLEAVATDPALAAPAPVVSASASLADRLAKTRDFRQDPDMRGWT